MVSQRPKPEVSQAVEIPCAFARVRSSAQKSACIRGKDLLPKECRNRKRDYNGCEEADLEYLTSDTRTVNEEGEKESHSDLKRNNANHEGKRVLDRMIERTLGRQLIKEISEVLKFYKVNIVWL